MRKTLFAMALMAGLATPMAGAMAEEAYVAPIKAYIEQNVQPWLSDPVVISAIKAQNEAHAGLSQADIDAKDKEWRAAVDGGDRAMIDGVLANALSTFLKQKQQESGDVITEVFVMDEHGLNVAASDVTSDMWQGDEAKFQDTYGKGAGSVHISEVELDESTQRYQGQISLTITDPDTGAPIGAITVGVDAESLL